MSATTPASERPDIDKALHRAEEEYISRHSTSRAYFEAATKLMPGGNTRSVLFLDPFPVYVKRGLGNKVWDHDNNEYLDLVGEFSAGLYGHSHPEIRQALVSTFDNVGISLGATTTKEIDLAGLICSRFPSIERVRFCNSGTEANLYAISIAKYFTGKRKIICFEGGYHGGVLSFGHGIGKNTVDKDDWILAAYNDIKALETLLEDTPTVAGVIIEAMQGAGGCVVATLEFLKGVQALTKKHGIIFILDEVMTSRLHPGGLHAKYGLTPDLVTLGKFIGGGLAFGAFGGRESLLSTYDPRIPSSLPHSGTFNNNTLAMSCGYVGLSEVYTETAAMELNAMGDMFRAQLQDICRHTKMVITGMGAVLTVHFLANGEAPSCAADLLQNSLPSLKKLFWYWCLQRGFWITERGMLSLILGTSGEELHSFIAVVIYHVRDKQSIIQELITVETKGATKR